MRYYSKNLGISLSDKGMAFASYNKVDKVWAGSLLNLHTQPVSERELSGVPAIVIHSRQWAAVAMVGSGLL